ncbi:MAG: DUF5717 family protein, partial [Eubacteriales bacterium]|nr:DUF5717 family protein [Eubacteriales bacterium]
QLARLPDFFLQSMPEDYQGEIPALVVEGAAHGTAVSGNNRAYWYRYLYENRGRYGAVYNRYREEIRSYLETQIAEHRITENLAFLYSASLRDPAIEPPNAGDLTKLSYMSHLRTTHMNMRWAVVVYANSSGEKRFPVVNGNCTMPLYGTDNCIFLEDAQHNRYAVSVPYTCDPMMQPVVRPDRVSAQEMDDLPFALEIAGAGDKEQSVTAQTAGYCALLVRSGKVSPSYRARLAYKLLLYYEKTGERVRMNSLWDLVDLTQLSREERLALLSLMSKSGQNTRAARWILSHGAAHIGAELLGEICLGAARETAADSMAGEEGAPGAEGKRSPSGIRVMSGAVRRKAEGQQYLTGRQLSRLAYGAFRRGFHSNDLLELLVREYDGSLQELDAMRKRLAQEPGREERTDGHDADLTLMACENRMLRQMLFSGDMVPEASGLIIRMYDRDDDRRGRELALYGLAQYCHYVFAQSRSMEENIMAFITRLKKDGQAHEPIVQLAFLKSLLERPNGFDEEEAEAASVFLTSLLGNNIVFPFYRRFSGAGAGLRLYDRETMIEYHRPAGVRTADGHVVIHYASSRGKQQEPFVSREMKEMVPGFYVSSFFLFYAEQIHYFITDDPEEKSIVETGTIVSDAYTGPGSQMAQDRFRRINELSECAAEGSRERTLQLLEEYRQREYLTSVLFDSGEEQA